MSTPEIPSVRVWCDLCEQPDALAAVDTLHEPDLPEGMVAIEHLRGEPLGQLEQLATVAGRRQRGDPHVARHVEVGSTQMGRPQL